MEEINHVLRSILKKEVKITLADDNTNIKVTGDISSLSLQERANISKYKNELIHMLRQSQESNQHVFTLIEKIPESCHYPMSDAQRRMWILCQFEKTSPAYNMPFQIEMKGSYNIHNFERAILAVIERHEILRTIFKEDDHGEVRQWVLKPEELEFGIYYQDFRKAKDRHASVRDFINQDALKAFDLEKGPLLRASLFQIDEDQYVFYVNMHHIIGDAWSIQVLTQDVLTYYEAYQKGLRPPVDKLRIQYRDYAGWQVNQCSKSSFYVAEEFWLDRLSGELPVLDLPVKRIRPKVRTHYGYSLGADLSPETTRQLKSFCREQGGSVFMGLLASWNILFYRYTAQKDIIIGTPVTGRVHEELENQIGFYVNTLALRSQIDPEEDFVGFYRSLKMSVLEAYAHQNYPFDRLVEKLGSMKDVSRNAVFDVMLALQNAPSGRGPTAPTAYSDKITDYGFCVSKFDMDIAFQEVGDSMQFIIRYNADVYEREMVLGLIQHYRRLLAALLKYPRKRISQINYLLPDEERKLLFEFNPPLRKKPIPTTVITLFEDQVEQTSNEIAVVYGETKLTYQNLNEMANKLAHYLKAKYHVGQESLIGIHLERSELIPVAILGVLKTGAAYIPMDMTLPSKRIEYMRDDSGCNVILDADEMKDFQRDSKQYPSTNLPLQGCLTDLAYIIYTSGTTGAPKGVAIEHGSLVNYITDAIQRYDLRNGSGNFGLFTSISFDLTVTSIFCSLIGGNTLTIFSPLLPIEEILDSYVNEDDLLNVIKLTPSHLRLLEGLPRKSSKLKKVIVGGEALTLTHLSILWKINSEIKVYNEYGPTEATVGCIVWNVPKNAETIFIGRPTRNTQVLILDQAGKLCPFGVEGEIHIGGLGLSRGYLNLPQLTKEQFVENPYFPKTRLYRTGDRGRIGADGAIEFLGRKDDQVKISGYRVELDEIESVLCKCSGVRDGAVVVHKNTVDDTQLVAYIVRGRGYDQKILRGELKSLLPSYMLPSLLVEVNEIPINANGKVDREALPGVDELRSTVTAYVEARDSREEKLANLWRGLLKVDRIGIHDDFFLLGGNSLLATRFISMVKQELGIRLTLEDIFNFSTIYDLSHLLADAAHHRKLGSRIVDLEMESQLAFDVANLSGLIPYNENPQGILLTGATGFVGAYLLKELLDYTVATIFCLVRPRDKDGAARIISNLMKYRLDHTRCENRIVVVYGDLSKPNLGLENAVYQRLAVEVDYIYHAGANMDLISSYEKVSQVNVSGNKEVLKLAVTLKLKKIIYTSTVSVFSQNGQYTELDLVDNEKHPSSAGYKASKCVGEKVLYKGLEGGVSIQIFRLGLLCGDTKHGIMPNYQWFPKLLKSSFELGMYFSELPIAAVPVDYVAQSMVLLSLRQDLTTNIFHLTNPKSASLKNFFDDLDWSPKKLRKVNVQEWLLAIKDEPVNRNLPIYPFIRFYSDGITNLMNGNVVFPEFEESNFFLSQERTSALLASKAEIKFPQQQDFIGRCLRSTVEDVDWSDETNEVRL